MAVILWTILTLPAVAFAADCLGEWNLHHGNSCYMFRKEAMPWQDADNFCRHRGGHLALVNDATEQAFLDAELKKRQSEFGAALWLDGTDMEVEGHWYWDFNGEGLDSQHYQHWRPNPKEPNNLGGHENCMEYGQAYNYYWNDIPCNHKNQFICEK